jgi:hypothetical protein
VTAEGPVTSIDPADEATALSIAVRYLGEEDGRAFVGQSLNPDSVIIRMRPERWLSSDYSKE